MAPTLFPESLADVSGPCFRRIKSRRRNMFPESYGVVTRAVVRFVTLMVLCLLVYYGATYSPRYSSPAHPNFSPPPPPLHHHSFTARNEKKLEKILKGAAMADKTVILTLLNEAWAAPNMVIDLFLESFRIGEDTRRLLNHLVIVALDKKAYRRCSEVHTHCFPLFPEGLDLRRDAYYMSPLFLKIAWERIDFMRSLLEMGYNFVFSDADNMWFRDPFRQFHPDSDFQIACDHFLGSSTDTWINTPNTGFMFVRSSNRTIEFYKSWYSSREKYPGYKDQDVLTLMIKNDEFVNGLGLKMRFLDTAYFGGFCEPSEDLNLVCTMHANCCYGLDNKLHDLGILLQDWKNFLASRRTSTKSSAVSWSVPQNCSLRSLQSLESYEKSIEQGLQE